jgi:hypothetical protein
MYDLWAANGRASPVVMSADSVDFLPVAVGDEREHGRLALSPLANPALGSVELKLEMVQPAPVALEVFDTRGRLLIRRDLGMLGGGTHRLTWDGRSSGGRDAGAGVMWVRVRVGEATLTRQVVRLR